MSEKEKIPKFTEFEVKYRTDISSLPKFQRISEQLPDLQNFLYTSGPDTYYTKSNTDFGRYREAQYPENGKKFAQWTVKQKPDGAKNNNIRFESNWDVSGTPSEEIHAGAIAMGYVLNFKIYKTCYIYKYKDATLVIYSVREDGTEKEDYFIEIEVDEQTIHNLTEDQAWEVISKYEKALEPVGITPQKRMRRSLFEMYVKESK